MCYLSFVGDVRKRQYPQFDPKVEFVHAHSIEENRGFLFLLAVMPKPRGADLKARAE